MKKLLSFLILSFLGIFLISCKSTNYKFIKKTINNKALSNLEIDNIKTNLYFENIPNNNLLNLHAKYKKGTPLNLEEFNDKVETPYDFSKYIIKKEQVIFVNRVEKDKKYFYRQTPSLHLGTIVKFISKTDKEDVESWLYDNVLNRVISLDFLKPVIFANQIIDIYTLTEEDGKEGIYLNGFRYINEESDSYLESINLENAKKKFKDKELKGSFCYDYLRELTKVNEKNEKIKVLEKNHFGNFTLSFKKSYIKMIDGDLTIFNEYYFKVKNKIFPNDNLHYLIINTNLNQVYFELFK